MLFCLSYGEVVVVIVDRAFFLVIRVMLLLLCRFVT